MRTAIALRFRKWPCAADTARGILLSWLPEAGLSAAPQALVELVLERMVKDGWLRNDVPVGGEPIYRRAPNFPSSPDA